MALRFCSGPLAVEPACAAGSDQHAMGTAGVGVELEVGAQRLMPRLGAGGLAHMHGAAIAALQGDGARRCVASVWRSVFQLSLMP